MAGGAAHRTPRHPGTVPAGAGGEGEDDSQQPGVRQRAWARAQRGGGAAHGLHRPGGPQQDDVAGEGGRVRVEPALRLGPAVHQPGEGGGDGDATEVYRHNAGLV